MNENQVINIIFAGVGGQGNILVAHLLSNAALEKGHLVRLTETFGAATRGGSVFSCLRIGQAGAPLPREHTVQILVALEPIEGLRRATQYLAPGGWVLANTRPWVPVDVSTGRIDYPQNEKIMAGFRKLQAKVCEFDAMDLALSAGSSRMMNIVLLGGLMALDILPVDEESVTNQFSRRWKKEIAAQNLQAFKMGRDRVRSILAERLTN